MPDDPLLSYYGHPVLPAGYNSWDINGDEVDGAGVNEPVWPVLFNAFIPLELLIITPEMLEVFDGCPDIAILGEPDLIMVPGEQVTYSLPALASTYVPTPVPVYSCPAVTNTIVLPADERALVITAEGVA